MTTVRDVMSTTIVSVEPSATISEAATAMGKHHVGSAVVLDGGRLVGIFTERDIVKALAADFDAPHNPVHEWMSRDPATIGPGASIEEALERMLAGGFRHLPVFEGDDLVGMVSIRDVSTARAQE
ncbi:MAG TPA: CBS domain-containing protein [Actinomycetota bacterium]|nr:CBS domain-containing protein [Actinomycetota bacterium]